ncbi:MAG TPA: response regulator [Bacteroidales bacterium]|nr:response regulator [Bacteroidales bacterium]
MERFKRFQEKLFDHRRNSLADYFSLNKKESVKILIVDDEKIHQLTLSSQLRRLGYHPEIANNGREALAMFSGTHYNIVFMDVEMPIVDGIEATKRILEIKQHRPVIIGHTTLDTPQCYQLCTNAGMTTVLQKPANEDTIKGLMEKISKPFSVNKR